MDPDSLSSFFTVLSSALGSTTLSAGFGSALCFRESGLADDDEEGREAAVQHIYHIAGRSQVAQHASRTMRWTCGDGGGRRGDGGHF